MSVSHSVVGNDPSEPDTFILQGQREVHERKHKEGNTQTWIERLTHRQQTVSTLSPPNTFN